MWRIALAGLIVAGLAADVHANGRPPSVIDIHFRQGHDADIVAGTSFGILVSHDSGATWHWMCEKAAHYGGMFDPDYSYSQSGAIFATSFDGLLVNRDGCTFAATPPGTTFVSQDELGPDQAFYYTAADPNDVKVYKSTNDGTSFPTSALPAGAMTNDWPQSLVVAPGNAQRLYLSSYRFNGTTKVFLMYTSANGGTSFTAASVTGFMTMPNSTIDLIGVDPANDQVVYGRVSLEDNNVSSGLYKSTNAGGSWTRILDKTEQIYAVVRSNGDIVAATETQGAWVSSDKGVTWTPLTSPPHIKCLAENAAHEVWACTQNYGLPGVPSDGYGIMKSTDLAAWTGVLKYQDIAGPVDCPTGTVQRDMCQGSGPSSPWCMVKTQLGITSTAIDCPPLNTVDGAPDAGSGSNVNPTPPKGCCDTGSSGGPQALLAGLVVGALLLRRRTPKAA